MNNNAEAKDGTVDFMNVNILKKNSVRGLLRKRAKKYDCKWTMISCYFFHIADEEDDDQGADSDNERMPRQPKFYNGRPVYQSGGVLKNSFAHAFTSILNNKIDDDKVE